MRNPARKALYALAALLLAAGSIRFGALRLERLAEDWPGVGAAALGFAIAPFALYTLVAALFAIRGRARLLMGLGVIARWQVDPADWKRFRGIDSRRSSEDLSLGNALWIRRAEAAGPVEVIVGERSVLVDGSYHSLRPGGIPDLRGVRWIDGPPACLEFALRYPRGRYGVPVPTTLRIPISPGARTAAVRVLEHFERLTRPSGTVSRHRPKTRRTAAILLLLAAAAALGIGYAVLSDLPPEARQYILPGIVIAVSVAAIFALAIALALYLFPPRT